jgi:hypothetical protein
MSEEYPQMKRPEPQRKGLTLNPLSFDEAVRDILKIKPEPKALKEKPPIKKRAKQKE